jgi:hypothetical protein
MGHVLGVVALLSVLCAGGTVWLLVRDERGHSRSSSARLLRRATAMSALVVLVTVAFLRPWYRDVAIGAVAVIAFLGVHVMLEVLEHRASPAGWGAIALAMASVVVASGIVTLAGTAAVLDGAALVGGKPVPVSHDGQMLAHPVLYQVFWGPAWGRDRTAAALAQAAEFQRALPASPWAKAVVGAGFGVRSFGSGGCWVDPSDPAAPGARAPASSMSSGAFPGELQRAFFGRTHLVPCPGFPAVAAPKSLPPDAVVALWVDPTVPYELGGVSVHGSVPWPGRPDGLAAVGLTGGFARWGQPSCTRRSACRSLASLATPSYALSHELVETVTNPYGRGWFADVPVQWSARYFLDHGPTSLLGRAPVFQGEVADLCEPGQPDAAGASVGALVAARGPQPLTVADFYRPGTGCVA